MTSYNNIVKLYKILYAIIFKNTIQVNSDKNRSKIDRDSKIELQN